LIGGGGKLVKLLYPTQPSPEPLIILEEEIILTRTRSLRFSPRLQQLLGAIVVFSSTIVLDSFDTQGYYANNFSFLSASGCPNLE
jgi:hypothetical protein